jgi:DNA repair protein RadC
MTTTSRPFTAANPRHFVRELVCAYRPARDPDGHVLRVSTLTLSDPRTAAQVLAPLLGDQPAEVFAVACLSARHRLLAWHVVSRGTRVSTLVSVP